MRLVSVPVVANLFLYYHENKWVCKVKKVDLNRATRLANVFRFIDDLTVINDCGVFEHTYQEMYHPELKLKKKKSRGVIFGPLYQQVLYESFWQKR